jgi:hypothetical protein
MAAAVDFVRLADALTRYDSAYLITVGDDHRPHTVMVESVLSDSILEVGVIGGRTAENVANHSEVTVLWPPREAGGYALMVDGRAELAGNQLRVVPTKALLHRKAMPGSPAAESGCLHDCVVFKA